MLVLSVLLCDDNFNVLLIHTQKSFILDEFILGNISDANTSNTKILKNLMTGCHSSSDFTDKVTHDNISHNYS